MLVLHAPLQAGTDWSCSHHFRSPDNLLTLDSISSTLYMFDGRGPVEAHAILLDVGCSLAELKWVRNHWSLIVWKRASMVRNAPSLLKDKKWWSFEAIVDQLRYR